MQSSFDELAAVPLENVTIVVPDCARLPGTVHDWPVNVVTAKKGVPTGSSYVLCGRSRLVSCLLREPHFAKPLYVVTDGNVTDGEATLHHGTPSVHVDGFDEDDAWEAVVAAVCSRHVRSIPWLVWSHACQRPDAEAVTDHQGASASYAELCSMGDGDDDRARDHAIPFPSCPSQIRPLPVWSCARQLGTSARR